MAFDANHFIVVETADGRIVQTAEDRICLQRKTDGGLCFVQPTTKILQAFNLNFVEDQSNSPTAGGNSFNLDCIKNPNNAATEGMGRRSSEPDEKNRRRKWSRNDILMLINLRIKYDEQFRSTTNKNEEIWKKVSEELKGHGCNMSSTQCNDKWRYLKARYTPKKDNKGDRGTGEEPIDFPYFEIMDNFLREKHAIKPVATASSIQGDTMPEVEELANAVVDNVDDSDTDAEPPKRKKKITSNVTKHIKARKTGLQAILEDMKQSSIQRENNRERRHQEMIESRKSTVDAFSTKMDLLIQTLNK